MINTPLTLFAVDRCQKAGDFFGLVPWYHYLKPSTLSVSCDVKKFTLLPNGSDASDVPLVLLAVIDDLLRIAAIVAIAFVIIGAIQFITSQGNSEDTAKAQGTIVNALSGLAIAIVAVAFVSFLGHRFGG